MISDYCTRFGLATNPGNFYRECSKLTSQGLIAPDLNPPDADPRRIPYRITGSGSREFASWLLKPVRKDWPLDGWLVFPELLSTNDRKRLLDQVQEELWQENKSLVRAREKTLARGREDGQHQPAALILLRRIKQTTTDLEFLEEVRQEFERVPSGTALAESKPAGTPRRAERKRQASGDR